LVAFFQLAQYGAQILGQKRWLDFGGSEHWVESQRHCAIGSPSFFGHFSRPWLAGLKKPRNNRGLSFPFLSFPFLSFPFLSFSFLFRRRFFHRGPRAMRALALRDRHETFCL